MVRRNLTREGPTGRYQALGQTAVLCASRDPCCKYNLMYEDSVEINSAEVDTFHYIKCPRQQNQISYELDGIIEGCIACQGYVRTQNSIPLCISTRNENSRETSSFWIHHTISGWISTLNSSRPKGIGISLISGKVFDIC
jgi:hypothetical protein